MRAGLIFIFTLISLQSYSQNSLWVLVRDASTDKALPGTTASVDGQIAVSSEKGLLEITQIPEGEHTVVFRHTGYSELRKQITIRNGQNDTITVHLHVDEHDLEEVVISTTRSSRTISNIPTRIELIAGEELDEKGNMKPGDIRMILNESTGIQTQQTSATSGNSSIRIQGLDGRYTQVLRDGFPAFAGAASGLGLLQTPPLDLSQVEVIKGSASTLYGGGAIAGLVNLISKKPGETRDLDFVLNGTSAGGLDLSGFYGERFGKAGVTIFASRNSSSGYAPGELNLTAIPKYERWVLNPKLFLNIDEKTSLSIGLNSGLESRIGGDIRYIREEDVSRQGYYEENDTRRFATQVALRRKSSEGNEFNLKHSISYFKRAIAVPGYQFEGTQHGNFLELSYSLNKENSLWIFGGNLWADQFRENILTDVPKRDYDQITSGAFVQNNYHATEWLELESGLRSDYIKDYGWALLPRVSALIKMGEKVTSRFGGGLGYKTPSIFTEESERIQYRHVLPLSTQDTKIERSIGANWDVNYRTLLFDDQVSFSLNNLLFYTYLNKPIFMAPAAADKLQFINSPGFITTKGLETNLKIAFLDYKLFIGYTLTDARIRNNGISSRQPLTARHRLNNVLMYEVEDQWKIGAEAYYYSSQILSDGATGRPYWIFGFMAEKLWEKFSLFINFENFSNTRQTRFDTLYTGSIAAPVFRDIYAPLDGFVVNGGLKLRL